MADTSDFTLGERLVTSVWVHERKQNNENMTQVVDRFRERFGKEPPSRQILIT